MFQRPCRDAWDGYSKYSSEVSKGTVWVNDHQLGRFWDIGPQGTLYLPGPWLKKKGNEIIVFDLKPQTRPVLKGLKQPVLDDLRQPHPSLTKQSAN
jgi:beta-galactosidase